MGVGAKAHAGADAKTEAGEVESEEDSEDEIGS